jgi:hypothetical protein
MPGATRWAAIQCDKSHEKMRNQFQRQTPLRYYPTLAEDEHQGGRMACHDWYNMPLHEGRRPLSRPLCKFIEMTAAE